MMSRSSRTHADQPDDEKTIPLMGQDQQPLCNLYTSMLRNGGVEIDRFSTATGPLDGLV